MISPPTSNRALIPRAYMTICWLVSGLLVLGASASTGHADMLLAWAVGIACYAACTVFIGVCERDRPGLRVQAAIPAGRLKRFVAFFFYSGSAGGVLWSLVMTLLSLAVGMAVEILGHSSTSFLGGASSDTAITSAIGFMGYMFSYALLAGLLVRWIGRGRLRTETSLAMALALMAVGAMGPAMLGLLLSPLGGRDNSLWWYAANPMAPFIAYDNREEVMLIGVASMAVMFILGVPWLIKQVRAFKPLPKPVMHATPAIEMATSEPQPEVTP